MNRLRVMRAPSRIWSSLHRLGLARARLPFWRVVVEGRLDHRERQWPSHLSRAVTGVFVWARTVEQAEGLAALALQHEGIEAITADAVRWPPGAVPSSTARAVARTPFGFMPRMDEDFQNLSSRRGAAR